MIFDCANSICRCEWRVLFKQVSREVNLAANILIGLLKGCLIGMIIFHVVPLLVDAQTRIDKCFMSFNPDTIASL